MAAASGVEKLEGFPDDYKTGHFVLIGASGSGKTYYAKYILKTVADRMRARGQTHEGEPPVFVYVGGVSAHDWTDPEADGATVVPEGHVFTAWDDDSHRAILQAADAAKGGFIVFDDFKDAMNFHTDRRFQQMFRAMRHMGVQLLAIGHTPNDVPPVVRDNVTHAVLFFTTNLEAMRELANVYLGGDFGAIRDAMRGLEGNAVFKINTRRNTRAIHAAPPPGESGIATSDVGLAEPLQNVRVGGGSLGSEVGGVGVSGRQVSVSGGTYNDASQNTQYLQLTQNIQAQIQQNQLTYADIRMRAAINREIDEARVHHNSRLKMLEGREELKSLLLSPWLPAGDRDRAASLLAQTLGDNTITPYNMFREGRDVAFMQTYYPTVAYTPKNDALAAASTYAPLAVAAAGSDRGAFMGEAFKALGPAVAQRASAGVALLTGGSAASRDTAKVAARKRARGLIVNRTGRRNGWALPPGEKAELVAALRPTLKDPSEVDSSNYVGIALDLLKEFFPADFEAERRLARR